MAEIAQLTREVVEWADSVFPDRGPESALLKLFEETGELVKDPRAAGEYADICIMIFDLAHMHGVDLAQAIRDKLALNRSRTWMKTATGTLQHMEPTASPKFTPSYDSADVKWLDGAISTDEQAATEFNQGKADAEAGTLRRVHVIEAGGGDRNYWYNRGYNMGVGE